MKQIVENSLESVRVPNQLLSPDQDEQKSKDTKTENEEEEIQEFSGAGSGAIVGHTGPLGTVKRTWR